MRLFPAVLVMTLAAFAPGMAGQRRISVDNPEWIRPFPAFRMIGNVYWVGTYDLSTYLITTSQGHILINTGLRQTVPQIQAGVARLGFRMEDVKLLTATHGHFDHAAGLAELRRLTHAQVVIADRDADLLESGGKSDFRFGDDPSARFEAVKVDRRLKDGDRITLGEVTLTAHLHGGHTRGATSFTFDVKENGRTYRVGIMNMASINPGVKVTGMEKFPDIRQAYEHTFESQKAMKIDVFLASHASQFELHKKYKPGAPYDAERFVDPEGFQAGVARLEEIFRAQLAKEKQAE